MRKSALAAFLALSPSLTAHAAEPGSEAVVAEQVWLELGAPEEGARREGHSSWLEVRGWAGVGTPLRHDVVVVVDTSGSTAYASGIDVDGDGRLGKARRRVDSWRSFNPRHLCSDPGDTVLDAELAATRRLIEVLDPERTRIGLVSFSGGAALLAPVGSDAAAMEAALDELEQNFGSGATNLAAATELATRALVEAGGERRQKTMLILSDGYPTAPSSEARAAELATVEARRAAEAKIRIHTFGLGLEEIRDDDVYAAMASVSGGRFRRLDHPGEIVHELPRIRLARVAGVEVENLTSGKSGRALRVFPDGSFDGYLELAPGSNQIRVTARGQDGGERSLEREVSLSVREPKDAAEAQAWEADRERLRAALALRAVETELADEARRGAGDPEQRRELEVEVEERAAD